jgi:hypothetical protein
MDTSREDTIVVSVENATWREVVIRLVNCCQHAANVSTLQVPLFWFERNSVRISSMASTALADICLGFLELSRQIHRQYLRLGHDSSPFFPRHYSLSFYYPTLCSLGYWQQKSRNRIQNLLRDIVMVIYPAESPITSLWELVTEVCSW